LRQRVNYIFIHVFPGVVNCIFYRGPVPLPSFPLLIVRLPIMHLVKRRHIHDEMGFPSPWIRKSDENDINIKDGFF
jgi:hypothetical protein